MTVRDGSVAGIPARLARVSFSGELAYELHVAGGHGPEVWEAVMASGEPFGIEPYGTEAMHVLRAEKGYVIVGQDTDGTVTPADLGMDWIVNPSKGDFVGRRSLRRGDTARPDRKHLVGLLPVTTDAQLPEGAQIVLEDTGGIPMPLAGHVTSSYRSPRSSVRSRSRWWPVGASCTAGPCTRRCPKAPSRARSPPRSCTTPKVNDVMARSPLTERSGHLERLGARELVFLAQVDVRADPSTAARLGFPAGPNTVASGPDRDILWLGPDEWLVVVSAARRRPWSPSSRPRLAACTTRSSTSRRTER
jgi:hypothetical protein